LPGPAARVRDRRAIGELLELLGEARDPALEDLFESALDGTDESLRSWAARGLRNLDTKTARTILWRHSHPEDTGR
jgi:hypothetical protein